ncbi:MAG: protein tyrosine phosphatase family protein [Pseudomonadota bacterium]
MADPTDILNWRRIDRRITTSGQPTEAQLAQIKDLGATVIVNLGPHSNDGALDDERGTVEGLGMRYVYIPVDFENPTQQDFDQFCSALEQTADTRVHVHCIYNARVSAFFYRYAREGRGGSEADQFAVMDGIWRPGGVWADFIGKTEDTGLENRFLGYEY